MAIDKDFDINYLYNQRDKYDKLMGEIILGERHLGKSSDVEEQKKKDLLLYKFYESQFELYDDMIRKEEEYSRIMY